MLQEQLYQHSSSGPIPPLAGHLVSGTTIIKGPTSSEGHTHAPRNSMNEFQEMKRKSLSPWVYDLPEKLTVKVGA